LIGTPRAILLDETLWGEGLLFEADIVALLERLSRRWITVVISAPNAVELHRVADRIVQISDGRIASRSATVVANVGSETPGIDSSRILPERSLKMHA
jgi:ABC-type molybdate transport system ATPase subunit